MLRAWLFGAAMGLVACGGPSDRGWGTHPCPEEGEYERPPFVPLVDGSIDEWSSEDAAAIDMRGDASAAFDIVYAAATSRGDDLFVRFTIDEELNLYNGDVDDGTLVLELRLPDERRIQVDFRARQASFTPAGGGARHAIPWSSLGLVAAPSHASRNFEIRFHMGVFDAAHGAHVEVDFSGSDSLEAPLSFPLRYGEGDPVMVDDRRAIDTTLRVASLNTEHAGLFDSSRSKPIGRLLRAAEADVYCLQELGQVSPEAITAALDAADPRGDGARWYAHASGSGIVGNAVVATHPLIPIPLFTTLPGETAVPGSLRAVGAVVDGPEPVAVISVHLKCCGYQLTLEDEARLAQVGHIQRRIEQLRAGQLGEALAPFRSVPIVVAGDFNHVGSANLVSDLVSPRMMGLTQLSLRHLTARDVFTWQGYESAFPPAVLDLLLFDGMEALGGFVLDSSNLPRERLETLGLWAGDSAASDHLMLVADFR